MNLVITLLQKELERQNLLIASCKFENAEKKGDPRYLPHKISPSMVQLRDQIEDAIAYLKTHK